VQSRGISVRVGKVLGTSLQKCIFNSKVTLLILVKSLENRKNANSILLDSWRRALQLLLNLSRLFPDNFCMKNRNVKNLDL
jgi:hypothetical protein